MREAVSGLLDLLCFTGMIVGLIMLMCEAPDLASQTAIMVKGVIVFAISALRPTIKSLRGDYQEDAETLKR